MSGNAKRKEWIKVTSSPPLGRDQLEQLWTRLHDAGIEVSLGPEGLKDAPRELCVHSEDLEIARQMALGSQEIYK